MYSRISLSKLVIILVLVICLKSTLFAQQDYVENQILIITKTGLRSETMESMLNKYNAKILKEIMAIKLNIVQFPKELDLDLVLNDIRTDKSVKWADKNYLIRGNFTPNDPLLQFQWGLNNLGNEPPGGIFDADVDAIEAWNISTGNTNVKIAILDTGIPLINNELSHPDLNNNSRIEIGPDLVYGSFGLTDPDPTIKDLHGHGTHITGIVGAEANNNTGISGIAPNCTLLAIQIGDINKSTTIAVLAEGIVEAVNLGAKIISISYGAYGMEQCNPIEVAVQYALTNNVLVVCSAGNEDSFFGHEIQIPARYSSETLHPLYPNGYPNVIAVGATDAFDILASYSCYGPGLNLVAPGGFGGISNEDDIYSTLPNYPIPNLPLNYGYAAGTSMAAPLVAGIAGLILSVNPSLTAEEIRKILEQSSDDKGVVGKDDYYGWGRANTYQALLMALAYSNNSTDVQGLSSNSQRKLARDIDGNYHLVYSSGNEIYYRRFFQNTWEAPKRLSNGDGRNNGPSITTGFFSGTKTVYIVWDKKYNNDHQIFIAASDDNGTTFSQSNIYPVSSFISTVNANPVITSNLQNKYNTLVYCTNSGTKSKFSSVALPIQLNWSAEQTLTTTSDLNPTLASCRGSSYNILAHQNSLTSHIYYRYQTNSGVWNATPLDLTNLIGGQYIYQNPTICGTPTDGAVHFACTRYTMVNGYPTNPQTFYRKNTSANGTWPTQYWLLSGNKITPSLTVLASNKIDLLYSNSNNIYKTRFNGSTWNTPTLVATNSGYPSVSIAGGEAKYVYSELFGGLPWQYTLSSETLNREILEPNNYSYSRSIALLNPERDFLELKIDKMAIISKDGSIKELEYEVNDIEDISLKNEIAIPILSKTKNSSLTSDVEYISIDYKIESSNANKIVSSIDKAIQFNIMISNNQNIQIYQEVINTALFEREKKASSNQILIPINRFNAEVLSEGISVNFELENAIINEDVFLSLGHIIDFVKPENKNDDGHILETDKQGFTLGNYPNPFNPISTIKYKLPINSQVLIKVFDILGKEVAELVNEEKVAGTYEINFNASSLASGVYFCRIQAGEFVDTKKMILMK